MIDFNGKSTKLFWKLKLLCCLRRTQLLLHKSIWEILISWVWKLKKFVFAKLLFSIVEILNKLIWLTKTCACSNFCVAAIVCWTHVNVYFFYTFGNPILSNGCIYFQKVIEFYNTVKNVAIKSAKNIHRRPARTSRCILPNAKMG